MRLRSFFEMPTAYSRMDTLTAEAANDRMSCRYLFIFNVPTQYTTKEVATTIRMPGNTNLTRYLLMVKSEMLDCSISNLMICAKMQSPIIVTNTK